MRKLRITVDGKAYEVLVESLDDGPESVGSSVSRPRPRANVTSAEPPPGAETPQTAPSSGPGDVVSPLAGRVVTVDCKVGDKVAAGTQLLTIEAMKMNTFVNSQSEGTVAVILVAAGDAVEEGQPLVTIE